MMSISTSGKPDVLIFYFRRNIGINKRQLRLEMMYELYI